MIRKSSLALKITNLTKIYKDSKKEFLALDSIIPPKLEDIFSNIIKDNPVI